MHGFNSGSALFVNAEVDSMGGFVDSGVGVGLKTSPRRAAIEKAQAELRQEYDVREERRRELEFLEKGGNPLDFKFGNAASISVQSTSLTDQHHEQLVLSEAKGSFALTASPHADSVDSSARPGAPSTSEPNTADNLLLFDGENEVPKGERSSLHLNRRNNITPPVQSSCTDAGQNTKESEDSAIVRPYARRNRSRPNHGPRGSSRDGKGLLSEKQKDHNLPSLSKPNPTSVNGDMVAKNLTTALDNNLDGVGAPQTAGGSSVPNEKLGANIITNSNADQYTLPSQNDSLQNPFAMASKEVNEVEEREPLALTDPEQLPSAATTKTIKETCSGQQNGFGYKKVNREGFPNEGLNRSAVLGMKNLDSQSSSTQASLGRDVNNNIDMCTNVKNIDANGSAVEQTSEIEKKLNSTSCEVLEERNKINVGENGANVNEEHDAIGYGVVKAEKDIHISNVSMPNEVNGSSNINGVQQNDHTVSKNGTEESDILVDHSSSNKKNCSRRPQDPADVSEHPKIAQAEKVTTAASDCGPCCSPHVALSNKAHEDSILEEARIIETKRKRIAELSIRTVSTQTQCKSHWDFVLEEMAWLANDFAQERLWKITAAAQLCHRAAFASQQRFEQKNQNCGTKVLAHTMAKAVMQFWHSVELLLDSDDSGLNLVESGKFDDEASRDERRNSKIMRETSKDVEGRHPRKNMALNVKAYALRFLQNNRSLGICSQAEVPTTPDRIYETSTVDMSWDDHLTEEILFYTVPSNAMDSYRKSVESHFLQFEKIGNNIQGEVETSMYDNAAEFGSDENLYDEDEAETSTYYLPGVYDGIKSSKSLQKKHKNMIRSYAPRSVEVGADYPYGHYASGSQPSMLLGKRPSSLNVVPITKRMRTSSRQRVVSPFTPGVNGMVQAQSKTDASSGDTNSFQDDQSTLHGGSQVQKSLEVESVRDFEKQLPYDCAETSVKTKKKKAKNLGSEYDHGWQLESVVPNDQRDHSKKRLDSLHFESNGGSGLYGQNNAKKPKIMKQPHDNNFDQITPMSGSIPSPAASQMSNMSNSSKHIRIISGRDRARKAKALKMCAGQPGSGSSWSLFEDQALVVLVHDMGPNWELISDAINTSLQFKCIFRKPKECKERHKILMDRTVGDGADSAEDSGSSQSYPSTLPGIPKGSARQLFQRLQGPMEEDTLKSHFEKIIKLGHKQHYRRNQNDSQDLKQIVSVHNSHVIALSQVCPNNLSGSLLTPLDLCDTNASTTDAFPHGYQGSHAGGLALPNHGSVPSLHPTPGVNSSLPGSSGMVLGSNLSSPGHITGSIRDSRYGVPRTSPLPVDEQQRMQYNQMLSARNIQQSSISVSGSLSVNDRGVRLLPGGNSMGMMGGTNRSMAMSRPGFQGMGSSSMLSSGSMLSSAMAGMPNPVNMPSGVGTGQGNSMQRPREGLHVMRPGHNPEHQRQVIVPELQMQATQGNSQSISAFNGLSSAFTNQTTPPPVQAYPGHAQQPLQMSQQQSHLSGTHPHSQGPNNATNSQHQAYAIRLAKERQLKQQQQQQQRYLQQQQFAASGALMPHVQAQSQLPISSPLQNNSQVQSQNSSQQVSHSPVTPSSPLSPVSSQHQQQKPMSSQHQQQKHHLPHGFSRNSGVSVLANQTVKQQQRQPMPQQYQQTGRQHPNQKQHSQSQQQGKLLKGIGRGNMVAHQNLSLDPSHLSGLSLPPGSQTAEKGDQMMHVMQGQNLYTGSGLNPNQSSKPLASAHPSNHSQLQQKLHSGTTPSSSKQHQPMMSPPDNSAQAQASSVPSGHVLSPAQPTVPSAIVASNHHQLQLHSKLESKQINQTQSNVQRMLQRQVHSESPCKSQSDTTQADQPANNASQVCTSSTMTEGCNDLANVVPAVPTVSCPWKTSEPLVSNIPNPATQAGTLECTMVGSSAGVEAFPNTSQGLSTRQPSVSMPLHAHNSGAQWQQQQPLPVQQSSTQPILSQQSYQSQELKQQQEQEQHSPKHAALPQQQVQHLQTGQSGLFMQPPNSKVE